MRAIAPGLCIAVTSWLLPGCGPKYYPVEGKVVWTDGTPAKELEGSQVVFESAEMKISARGTVGADGGFTMTMINPDDGVPAGTYKVAIVEEFKPLNADGSKVKPPALDSKYYSLASSGLTATVTSGKNPVELKVERAKGGGRTGR
jgi:hypothetical protein